MEVRRRKIECYTYKNIDSVLKCKEERWSVRTYKKIDSVLEVRRKG